MFEFAGCSSTKNKALGSHLLRVMVLGIGFGFVGMKLMGWVQIKKCLIGNARQFQEDFARIQDGHMT